MSSLMLLHRLHMQLHRLLIAFLFFCVLAVERGAMVKASGIDVLFASKKMFARSVA